MRTRIRKAAELSRAPSRATRKQISYGRNGASEEQSSRAASDFLSPLSPTFLIAIV